MAGASALLVRGIVGIIIGIVAFAWPGLTIAVLVGIFGAYALIDGASNLVAALSHRSPHAWLLGLEGLAGIAAAIVTFLWPGITAVALLYLIAAWAVVTGVLEIAAAVRLRRVIAGEWMLALSGTLSIVFGILLFAFPALGAIGIAWTLGAYAIAAGVVLVALGVRLHLHAVA